MISIKYDHVKIKKCIFIKKDYVYISLSLTHTLSHLYFLSLQRLPKKVMLVWSSRAVGTMELARVMARSSTISPINCRTSWIVWSMSSGGVARPWSMIWSISHNAHVWRGSGVIKGALLCEDKLAAYVARNAGFYTYKWDTRVHHYMYYEVQSPRNKAWSDHALLLSMWLFKLSHIVSM